MSLHAKVKVKVEMALCRLVCKAQCKGILGNPHYEIDKYEQITSKVHAEVPQHLTVSPAAAELRRLLLSAALQQWRFPASPTGSL